MAGAQSTTLNYPTGAVGTSSTGNIGIGTTAPVDQLEIVSGNRKIGFNTPIPGLPQGVTAGGILSLSRPDDGVKILYLGGSASPTDDHVIFGQGGGSEMRLVSAGGTSAGFGFYTNIGFSSAFGSSRPTPVMKIDGSGNVGLGTASPNAKLHIISQAAGTAGLLIQGQNGDNWFPYSDGKNYLRGTTVLADAGGNVGIGTASPDAKLAVSGQVHAQEVKVSVTVPGPDYVFEKDYKLSSLEEIKNYIDQNKHLPEVPSAKEMEKNGIQLGEMNMLLLKKIEELTLYVIELKNENVQQNKINERQQEEIGELKKTLDENLKSTKK